MTDAIEAPPVAVTGDFVDKCGDATASACCSIFLEIVSFSVSQNEDLAIV